MLEKLAALVVDDNATNRRILFDILSNWRMRPTLADGGEAALHELRRAVRLGDPFPLALVDAQMPGMDGFTLVESIRADPELSAATIMMLSSNDLAGDAARCRALGVAAYLCKPIRPSELRSAILDVLGLSATTVIQISAADPRSNRPMRSLRILLAEDNVVNQRLVTRVLERRGHSVAIAGDGRQALEAIGAERFDLVLMDVQMPEMDGFEATAVIRERESANGDHVPIVALTAHAMKGDELRCRQAGMDAYLTKPLDTARLVQITEAIAIGE